MQQLVILTVNDPDSHEAVSVYGARYFLVIAPSLTPLDFSEPLFQGEFNSEQSAQDFITECESYGYTVTELDPLILEIEEV